MLMDTPYQEEQGFRKYLDEEETDKQLDSVMTFIEDIKSQCELNLLIVGGWLNANYSREFGKKIM